jgi:hypothetical protein
MRLRDVGAIILANIISIFSNKMHNLTKYVYQYYNAVYLHHLQFRIKDLEEPFTPLNYVYAIFETDKFTDSVLNKYPERVTGMVSQFPSFLFFHNVSTNRFVTIDITPRIFRFPVAELE